MTVEVGLMASVTKGERLLVYFTRMSNSQPATSHDEAMLLLEMLNEIENELSEIPYDPDEPGTDGRMYPPNAMFRYKLWERSGVQCYRQAGHATFVADNGAIEICKRVGIILGQIIFEKPGRNDRKVSDYDSSE